MLQQSAAGAQSAPRALCFGDGASWTCFAVWNSPDPLKWLLAPTRERSDACGNTQMSYSNWTLKAQTASKFGSGCREIWASSTVSFWMGCLTGREGHWVWERLFSLQLLRSLSGSSYKPDSGHDVASFLWSLLPLLVHPTQNHFAPFTIQPFLTQPLIFHFVSGN